VTTEKTEMGMRAIEPSYALNWIIPVHDRTMIPAPWRFLQLQGLREIQDNVAVFDIIEQPAG
jgi:hypothetical protein